MAALGSKDEDSRAHAHLQSAGLTIAAPDLIGPARCVARPPALAGDALIRVIPRPSAINSTMAISHTPKRVGSTPAVPPCKPVRPLRRPTANSALTSTLKSRRHGLFLGLSRTDRVVRRRRFRRAWGRPPVLPPALRPHATGFRDTARPGADRPRVRGSSLRQRCRRTCFRTNRCIAASIPSSSRPRSSSILSAVVAPFRSCPSWWVRFTTCYARASIRSTIPPCVHSLTP